VKKRFPHFWMRNTWGMTEVTGAAATSPPELQSFENAHTVGKALPGMSIKAIDPITGKEVGPNENGEVRISYKLFVISFVPS
jgi:4-coumarate--CoA ligase